MTYMVNKEIVEMVLDKGYLEYVYPNIKIKEWDDRHVHYINLFSYVRVKRNNKWYLIPCFAINKIELGDKEVLFRQFIKEFLVELYKLQLFYIVSNDLQNEGCLQLLDTNQQSEEDRMKELLK